MAFVSAVVVSIVCVDSRTVRLTSVLVQKPRHSSCGYTLGEKPQVSVALMNGLAVVRDFRDGCCLAVLFSMNDLNEYEKDAC